MSELDKENAQLKQQLQNQTQGVNQLLAQLDAYKATLNDMVNNSVILRMNFTLSQKQVQELNVLVDTLKKELKNLQEQKNAANP